MLHISKIQEAMDSMEQLVSKTKGFEKTPVEKVRKECRRSGSRDNDYIEVHDLVAKQKLGLVEEDNEPEVL